MVVIAALNRATVPPELRAIQERVLPPGWELRRVEGLEGDLRVRALRERAPDAEYLLVDRDVDRQIIDALPALKLIQVVGVGYDSIDVEHAARRRVAISTAAGLNRVAVAEYTIGLAFAAARNIARVDRAIRRGEWPQHDHRAASIELAGKTWGTVGFGQIGREVGRRAHLLGMEVYYHDVVEPRPEATGPETFPATPVPLDRLLEVSDVVSLHLPLTPATHHVVDQRALDRMKSSAVLVNTARGALVDTQALTDALGSGAIAAAALDVFEEEPLPDSPLRALDNVVLSSHTAAGTGDTVARVLRFCVENIERVRRGLEPLNNVSPATNGTGRK